MSRVILFNKPYGVLCQFRASAGRLTLKDFINVPGFYAAGRLDADSEGLVALTNDGALQHRISDPTGKTSKTYCAQVEGAPTADALMRLGSGVQLGDFVTLPASVQAIEQPDWLWPRDPPIRFRKLIPTSWLELTLREGKNRQVRRMTAAVGYPTLRLVRFSIGEWTLEGLTSGKFSFVDVRLSRRATRRSR